MILFNSKIDWIIAAGFILYIFSFIAKNIFFPGDTFQATTAQLQLVSWINLVCFIGMSVSIALCIISSLRHFRKKRYTIKYLAPGLIGIFLALVFLSTSIFNLIVLSDVKRSNETISKELQRNGFIKLDEKTEKNRKDSELLIDKGILSVKRNILNWSIILVVSFLIGGFSPIKLNTS